MKLCNEVNNELDKSEGKEAVSAIIHRLTTYKLKNSELDNLKNMVSGKGKFDTKKGKVIVDRLTKDLKGTIDGFGLNDISKSLGEALDESTKGLKSKFPELFKVIIKDGGADIARDAEEVIKVETKGGDVYVVKTSGHATYFSLKHGWIGEEDEGLDHKDFEKHQPEFDKNLKKGEKTKITEAQHYNTKVRGLDEKMGSRKIRMGLKESKRYVENMLKPLHESPNPLTDRDRKLLQECNTLLEQTIPRLKEVKETKRRGNR